MNSYGAMDIHNIHLSTFVVDVSLNGEHKWIARHWLPAGSLNECFEYKFFAEQGLIKVMPGETSNIYYLLDEIKLLREQYGFVEISIDEWNPASILTLLLRKDGFQIVNHMLSFSMLSVPTRAFLYMRHQLLIENPVLAWMFGNTRFIEDMFSNKKPAKINNHKPIGGLIAGIMALGRAIREDEEIVPMYSVL